MIGFLRGKIHNFGLDYCLIEKKLSQNTIITYKNDLNKYSNYFKNKKMDEINKDHLIRFIEALKEENLSEKTPVHLVSLTDKGKQDSEEMAK